MARWERVPPVLSVDTAPNLSRPGAKVSTRASLRRLTTPLDDNDDEVAAPLSPPPYDALGAQALLEKEFTLEPDVEAKDGNGDDDDDAHAESISVKQEEVDVDLPALGQVAPADPPAENVAPIVPPVEHVAAPVVIPAEDNAVPVVPPAGVENDPQHAHEDGGGAGQGVRYVRVEEFFTFSREDFERIIAANYPGVIHQHQQQQQQPQPHAHEQDVQQNIPHPIIDPDLPHLDPHQDADQGAHHYDRNEHGRRHGRHRGHRHGHHRGHRHESREARRHTPYRIPPLPYHEEMLVSDSLLDFLHASDYLYDSLVVLAKGKKTAFASSPTGELKWGLCTEDCS